MSQPAAAAEFKAAKIHDENGDPAKAIIHYRKAIEAGFDHGDVWFPLGMCYVTVRDYAPALECWKRVLELDPSQKMAINNKADCLLHLGAVDEAMKVAREAIGAGALHAWHTLAECHLAQGRKAEAVEALESLVAGASAESQALADHARKMIADLQGKSAAAGADPARLEQFLFTGRNSGSSAAKLLPNTVFVGGDAEREQRQVARMRRLLELKKSS